MAAKQPTLKLSTRPKALSEGGTVDLFASPQPWPAPDRRIIWDAQGHGALKVDPHDSRKAVWDTTRLAEGRYTIRARLVTRPKDDPSVEDDQVVLAEDSQVVTVARRPSLTLRRAVPETINEGGLVVLEADAEPWPPTDYRIEWDADNSGTIVVHPRNCRRATWDTTGVRTSVYRVRARLRNTRTGEFFKTQAGDPIEEVRDITVAPRPLARGDVLGVTLSRTATVPTPDLPLWVVIQNATEALSFDNYSRFMDIVLCGIGADRLPGDVNSRLEILRTRRALPYNDADAYRLLKVATEAFLMVNCGVAGGTLARFPFTDADRTTVLNRLGITPDLDRLWNEYLISVNGGPDATLPYLALVRDKLRDQGRLKRAVFTFAQGDGDLPEECFGILREKLTSPCFLELIWSYWHEEGMLVQTMNAISRRFQNIRGPGDRDPLATFEVDPLRPLNNLLWGYLQDEQHRLTLVRRAYEYDHHYGIALVGKAVPQLRPADSRSKFLEAFHNLLYLCTEFFGKDDMTTVIADGFPLLNALKEVHLILSEGAHNQFGDLPSTARQEMLIQQWLLARPEFREFLPTRIMVAYPERWMDRVDAMKNLQGWTDVSVLHFRNLAVFGEQVLLTIRFGAWSTINDAAQAATWARFWRSAIQGYIHAYRSVTGVDLTADITDSRGASERYLPPAVHLQRRLSAQQQKVLPVSNNGANIPARSRALIGNGRK